MKEICSSGRHGLRPQPRSPLRTRSVRRVSRSRTVRPTRCDAGKQYDYVVVGGGTAGCVLANRLSADESKNVLVLEAGPVKSDMTVKTPAGIVRLFKSAFDWNLYTTRQTQLDDRYLYLARGKLIGGSSCTNATLYHRGTAEDYDNWGVEGWGSKDVLEWFKKVEANSRGESEVHGANGFMSVEDPRYSNRLFENFFRAAEEVGLKENKDFNDWRHSQEGYGNFQVTQDKGVRADMFTNALKPVLGRSNLDVQGGAITTKVVFEEGAGGTKAVGVEYALGGIDGAKESASLAPGGEVLMCAGAIHSPSILMLSGIGPKSTLENLDIPVVADLEGVGQNLQDHPACLSAFKLKPQYESWCVTDHVYNNHGGIRKRALLNYLLFKRGPLATTGCDRGAFVSTTGSGQPDLQMRFTAGFALDPDGVSAYVRFGELLEQGEKWPGGVTFQNIACRPKSKGSVTLSSDDPFASPKINIGYLTDPEGEDARVLREGLKLSRKMASSEAWGKYLEEERFPGADKASDEALDQYVRDTLHSANAVVGSCRMGVEKGDGSVVDPELKVHGIEGLRVVDASVIPVIPGGQTGAPVIMLADRIASKLTS
ncbi:hypothetical protein BSKO_06585 [Bryopsis sp. KO-2023]|nr:hypothetical protein BSKO_06585 [Bryopsis sp. KO-2023]